MLLVADVGNTHTVFGLLDGARVVVRWRVATTQRTVDELGAFLLPLLQHEGVSRVDGLSVGSVVPVVVDGMRALAGRYLGCPVRVFDGTNLPGLVVDVDVPAGVGPDRVLNVYAAKERWPGPFVVVDLGTATTFDCCDARGAFVGGAIAPGLRTATDALTGRTARLPAVPLGPAAAAIGRTTADALRAGAWFGYAGLVDALVRRCKGELGAPGTLVPCLATGGLAALVAPGCTEVDAVDPDLTLHGLRLAWERSA